MADLPRERLFQGPPGTRNEKNMGVFSHVFQVEQFVLNLQIHYLPLSSHKHFKDSIQEEVMFESLELITAQILLGPMQN